MALLDVDYAGMNAFMEKMKEVYGKAAQEAGVLN